MQSEVVLGQDKSIIFYNISFVLSFFKTRLLQYKFYIQNKALPTVTLLSGSLQRFHLAQAMYEEKDVSNNKKAVIFKKY